MTYGRVLSSFVWLVGWLVGRSVGSPNNFELERSPASFATIYHTSTQKESTTPAGRRKGDINICIGNGINRSCRQKKKEKKRLLSLYSESAVLRRLCFPGRQTENLKGELSIWRNPVSQLQLQLVLALACLGTSAFVFKPTPSGKFFSNPPLMHYGHYLDQLLVR